jgi:hypothetical protein
MFEKEFLDQYSGFTRTDLIVVIAAILVLSAFVYVPLTLAQQKGRRVTCSENLKDISRAISLYSGEHNGVLPGPAAPQPGDYWWWYKEQVKGYLGMKGPSSGGDERFACPGDRGYSDPQPFHASARFDYGSYVFNGVELLGTPNIAGWKTSALAQPNRTLLVMEWTAHAPLSWHRSRTGRANAPFYPDAESVVAFADGAVRFIPIYFDGYNAAYTRDPIAGYEYRYSGR